MLHVDDLPLGLQRALDRLIRRFRLGTVPVPDRPRLLVVQIDGLSRAVFDEALAAGAMPFLRRLLDRGGHRVTPLAVGMPTSTPAFQMAAMYGVRPDIPGFHYHDKRRGADIHFPHGGDAALVESAHTQGRAGIVRGGSTYGCVFTGGADNSLFSFSAMSRPTGRGLLRAISAFVVLLWVFAKSAVRTAIEIVRALLRFVSEPVGRRAPSWKWLTIKLAISVWLRGLFTLAVSRDLYAAVPSIYVNYLDYDVAAHVFGPRHHRALRALRRVDRALAQLWRIVRRVPELRYELHVLSDHGMAACLPYDRISGGRRLERLLLDEFFDARGAASTPRRLRGVGRGIAAFRRERAPGVFQRFVNYLEDDFPWVLGEAREVRERAGVRVISAGPNAFVYWIDTREPLSLETIDERVPGIVDEISRSPGIGFLLARSVAGPVCIWRGKRYRVVDAQTGPFSGRSDWEIVRDGLLDLMAMPSAGDLVVYGIGAPEGDVSFISEVGAHAGPSQEELHTFIVCPAAAPLRAPVGHPLELYDYFMRYQERA